MAGARALAVALYYARMFFLTAGFHRYFSHRAFKTSRAFQLVLAIGGVLWCAYVHSPRHGGLWWSHAGWILSSDHERTDFAGIRDFARYPELRWLNRHFLVPPLLLAVGLFLAGGWPSRSSRWARAGTTTTTTS